MTIEVGKSGSTPVNSTIALNVYDDLVSLSSGTYLKSGVIETDNSPYPECKLLKNFISNEPTRVTSLTSEDNMVGLAWDGTHWYALGAGDEVFQYEEDWTYTGLSNTVPLNSAGLTIKDGKLWTISGSYAQEFDKLTGATTGNLWSASGYNKAIVWTGTHFWCTSTTHIQVYTEAGVKVGDPIAHTVGGTIRDLEWDGESVWILSEELEFTGTEYTLFQYSEENFSFAGGTSVNSNRESVALGYKNPQIMRLDYSTSSVYALDPLVGVGIFRPAFVEKTNLPIYLKVGE